MAKQGLNRTDSLQQLNFPTLDLYLVPILQKRVHHQEAY